VENEEYDVDYRSWFAKSGIEAAFSSLDFVSSGIYMPAVFAPHCPKVRIYPAHAPAKVQIQTDLLASMIYSAR
jgi:hypothetical protein